MRNSIYTGPLLKRIVVRYKTNSNGQFVNGGEFLVHKITFLISHKKQRNYIVATLGQLLLYKKSDTILLNFLLNEFL